MSTKPAQPRTEVSPEKLTRRWFESVVLGLNLCPFAHKPARDNTIRFTVCDTNDEGALLEKILEEIKLLADTAINKCETTVIIAPNLLDDFYDYQFFLSEAERKLKHEGWKGTFQLASFHPNYCFAGTTLEEPSNLTNRSPYPLIHILREASLTAVLENVDKPDDIPQRNMERMENLNEEEKARLFFYLK